MVNERKSNAFSPRSTERTRKSSSSPRLPGHAASQSERSAEWRPATGSARFLECGYGEPRRHRQGAGRLSADAERSHLAEQRRPERSGHASERTGDGERWRLRRLYKAENFAIWFENPDDPSARIRLVIDFTGNRLEDCCLLENSIAARHSSVRL